MAGIFTRFNERLAVWITERLGTMGCTYAFLVLCVLPLVLPSEQANILYVSNCFQLVFLPLLMVSGLVQGRKAETRAVQDHAAIMESHDLIMTEMKRLEHIQEALMALECRRVVLAIGGGDV